MNLKSLNKDYLDDKGSFSPLILVIFILCALSIALSISISSNRNTDGLLGSLSKTRSTIVSASVGEFRFSLDGYTSPLARVTLEGQGLFEETTADRQGYFSFTNRFSPFTQREACITAKDTGGRISAPFCLPPFSTRKNVHVGPIIIAPTLTLNQDIFAREDFGISTGKGVPNSTIYLDIISPDLESPLQLHTLTDAEGDYSITLPTQKTQSYSISTRNTLNSLESTRSTSLTFAILPYWLILLRFLLKGFSYLKVLLLPVLILIEVLILIYIAICSYKRQNETSQRVKHA